MVMYSADLYLRPLSREHQPWAIGHRGSAYAIENTIEAVRQAAIAHADYAEIDVQLSADGIPVVYHDPTLTRLSGVNKKVEELTAEQLLQGLTNLTGYHFDAEKVETNGKNITVFWADTASFFSDTGTKAEATAELAFQDFASQLQFMLDSTYVTLTKNLDVTNVYYVTSTGTPLDFTEQANWTLSADQFYSGTFGDYYLDETTDGGDASNPDKDGKEFIFLDQRADPAASGADLSPEAAAQSVYDALVLDYKGDTDEREWVIALDEITQVDGSEAYAFSVGQGTEETFDTYFHAAITYDGNVYMMENGASEYSSYDQPET